MVGKMILWGDTAVVYSCSVSYVLSVIASSDMICRCLSSGRASARAMPCQLARSHGTQGICHDWCHKFCDDTARCRSFARDEMSQADGFWRRNDILLYDERTCFVLFLRKMFLTYCIK